MTWTSPDSAAEHLFASLLPEEYHPTHRLVAIHRQYLAGLPIGTYGWYARVVTIDERGSFDYNSGNGYGAELATAIHAAVANQQANAAKQEADRLRAAEERAARQAEIDSKKSQLNSEIKSKYGFEL